MTTLLVAYCCNLKDLLARRLEIRKNKILKLLSARFELKTASL